MTSAHHQRVYELVRMVLVYDNERKWVVRPLPVPVPVRTTRRYLRNELAMARCEYQQRYDTVPRVSVSTIELVDSWGTIVI